jgi:formylglycine-generating enzyme required for sulfatase activity
MLVLAMPVSAQTSSFDEALQQARALQKEDRLPEALARAEAAAKLAPDRFEPHALRALILQNMGRHEEAQKAIEQARKRVSPEDAGKLQKIAALIEGNGGATSGAKPNAEQRLKYTTLMLVLEEADKAPDAASRTTLQQEFLNKSAEYLQVYPNDARVWTLRAKTCLELNRADDGILAARELRRLQVLESEDESILRVGAQLDRKGWFTAKTTTEMAEAEARAKLEPALAEAKAKLESAKATAVQSFSGKDFSLEGLALKMLPVQPGYYLQGNLLAMPTSNAQPGYAVMTRGFWLSQTEVTQAQYYAIMQKKPSCFVRDNDQGGEMKIEEVTDPVEQVSWDDAMEFCRRLTESERKAGRLPAGYVYTLPTEAQWEYACRAGTTGDYAGNLDDMAWYGKKSGVGTHSVATKKANAWGFFDMHGNVWEWCLDWYAAYPTGLRLDYAGPASGPDRVVRGGSWINWAGSCRSAGRGWSSPGSRDSNLGFRVALSAVQ